MAPFGVCAACGAAIYGFPLPVPRLLGPGLLPPLGAASCSRSGARPQRGPAAVSALGPLTFGCLALLQRTQGGGQGHGDTLGHTSLALSPARTGTHRPFSLSPLVATTMLQHWAAQNPIFLPLISSPPLKTIISNKQICRAVYISIKLSSYKHSLYLI